MPIGLVLTTAPASEPVTRTEAKARLRVTVSDSDTDIDDSITEARALCEQECGRAFLTQTWTLTLDDFPLGYEIRLPRPPLASVTHVKYYDEDGVQQTFSSSNYFVDTGTEPGRIWLSPDATWPTVQYGRPGAVEIRYVAGWASAALVPKTAKSAILAVLWHKFNTPDGGEQGIPPAARRLLNSLEVGEVW